MFEISDIETDVISIECKGEKGPKGPTGSPGKLIY